MCSLKMLGTLVKVELNKGIYFFTMVDFIIYSVYFFIALLDVNKILRWIRLIYMFISLWICPFDFVCVLSPFNSEVI